MQQTQQQHTTVTEDDRDFSVTVRQDDDTGRWQPSISENGWEWEGDIPDFATAGEALTWARRMIAEQVQEDQIPAIDTKHAAPWGSRDKFGCWEPALHELSRCCRFIQPRNMHKHCQSQTHKNRWSWEWGVPYDSLTYREASDRSATQHEKHIRYGLASLTKIELRRAW